MKTNIPPKYPLPRFLLGTTSQYDYGKWLEEKSETLFEKDKHRNRPYALSGSAHLYKEKIHNAVAANGSIDPYTGGKLRWDLIQKWDDSKDKGHDNYIKEFCLLPTVDHKDPYSDAVEFEICSWLINDCKNDQTPEEFIKMCGEITAYRAVIHPPQCKAPAIYFLPSFLNGICTERVYKKWLDRRAGQLYLRDRDQGRPYGLAGSKALYKKTIHAAVNAAGLYDPYTGATMKWELIGTWIDKDQTDAKNKDYYLLPTVDHVDPYADVLELEICSWRINECKGGLTPDEFVDVCRRVEEYNKKVGG